MARLAARHIPLGSCSFKVKAPKMCKNPILANKPKSKNKKILFKSHLINRFKKYLNKLLFIYKNEVLIS